MLGLKRLRRGAHQSNGEDDLRKAVEYALELPKKGLVQTHQDSPLELELLEQPSETRDSVERLAKLIGEDIASLPHGAKQRFKDALVAQQLGVKLKDDAPTEMVSLESSLESYARMEEKINDFSKEMRDFKGGKLRDRRYLSDFKLLSDAGVINSNDFEIYKALIKKVDKLYDYQFVDSGEYQFRRFGPALLSAFIPLATLTGVIMSQPNSDLLGTTAGFLALSSFVGYIGARVGLGEYSKLPPQKLAHLNASGKHIDRSRDEIKMSKASALEKIKALESQLLSEDSKIKPEYFSHVEKINEAKGYVTRYLADARETLSK